MAARNKTKFLTPKNIDGGAAPAQNRDVGGGGRELATLNPQGAVANPAPEKPVEERERLSGRLPPYKLARFESVAQCSENDVEVSKISEIISLIWMPRSLTDPQREALLLKAIDLFESFEPSDGIEATLAVQMVGTHNAIVECLRRAMIHDQPLEAQKVYLSQAERLMGLYTRHLDALAKHRGKTQPNITVGQVNVESGGQAIVGNVGMDAGGAAPVPSPPLIEGADAPPAVADLKKPTRGRARQ